MIFPDQNYQISEQIYASQKTLVYRGNRIADGQGVTIELIRSNYSNLDEVLLFQNHFNLIRSLDLPGVIKAIDFKSSENNFALVLEDFGDRSLQDYFIALNPQNLVCENTDNFLKIFFPIAIQIAEILGGLYLHGIIHQDINPANIQIDSNTRLVKLNNFGYAMRFTGEEQQLATSQAFAGTLDYASPEQTGRTHHPIDYRSDFYAVGVTFYELLTGKLPFNVTDPLADPLSQRIELIHCHLTKLPIPVSNINPLIPPTLSAIIAKLMAKNAADRYQSALGLQRDLEYCWSQWQLIGKIETFELGKKALGDRFMIPERLYGRTVEVQLFLAAFARIAATTPTNLTQSSAELILLSGFFGVGKTAIVNQVYQQIIRQKGYFIQGKFGGGTTLLAEDQPQQQEYLPFSAFIQAFSSLIGQLLSEDDDRLAQSRANMLAVLGGDGQVIIDVIPELAQIIGQQPPVIALSGRDTHKRFKLLFQKFIKFLATLEQPLVIFLDNIQSIDDDSLELLRLLMQEGKKLLMIGTYRDNELSGIHPLMLTVNQIKQMGIAVSNIMVSPLSKLHITELVADSFNCSIDSVRPFAALVYQKTNGNPFFAIKFLKSLERDGLIKFNPQVESWQCDLSQIKIQWLTNDEIELMTDRLQQLSLSIQQILKLAACMGMEFDLHTLAIVSQQSQVVVAKILSEILQEGSIVPLQETYHFCQLVPEMTQLDPSVAVYYRFSHDRVQQAAYSLIPELERASYHDRIGELLLEQIVSSTPPPAEIGVAQLHWMNIAAGHKDRFLIAINQLNYSIGPTLDRSKRDLLIQLNLTASRQARAANDYRVALEYAQIGLQLLGGAAWQQEYAIAVNFHELAIEVAALCGEFELMNQWIDQLIARTKTPLELVSVYVVKIQSLVSQHHPITAIALARSLLSQLGVELPLSPMIWDVEQAMRAIDDLTILQGRGSANEWSAVEEFQDRRIARLWKYDNPDRNRSAIEALIDLPTMTDPQQLAMMQVAASIIGACYVTNPLLYALVVALQVNLSIQYGNSSTSAYSYAAYGIMLNTYRQNVRSADQFSRLALSLADRPNSHSIRPETLVVIGLSLHHRSAHLRTTMPILQAGYQAGLATGKLEYVGYHIQGLCSTAYWCGDNLTELEPQLFAYRQQLLDLNQLTTANYCTIYCEIVMFLLGNVDTVDRTFARIADEDLLFANKDLVRVFIFYLHRAMLRFLMEDIARANADILLAREYLDGVTGLIDEVGFYFYDSLIALAGITATDDDSGFERERVRANQQQLAHWAKYAPMNHLHKWQLVEAEIYRVLGDKAAAIELYDLAISGAQGHEFIQEAALAKELAAKFYLTWGKAKIAADYLQAACHCYTQWGAIAKIQDLTSRYPHLLAAIFPTPDLAPVAAIANQPIRAGGLGRLDLPNPNHRSLTNISASNLHGSILDFNAYIKVIQALYSEIDLDRLLKTLIDVVVENAGANKAALLLNNDGNLTIAIESDDSELDTLDFNLHPRAAASATASDEDHKYRLPLFLIRHVHRTQATEIHHGDHHPYLASDPYFEKYQPQSILCVPILNQSKLIGILYLENALTSGAFTRDRVELLNVICTQAAISIENARLHRDSQNYAQRLEQSILDLQFSEARLHKIADNVPGVIAQCCVDLERGVDVVCYISSGCYELYEVTAGTMIAERYSLRCFEHPEDRPAIDQVIQATWQNYAATKFECRIITASGKVKWIQVAASSLEPQADGSLLNECTILDISDRKQAELKLQATNEELIRSNRLKDQFLANMSHELRTPLNAILGMTEGLKEQVFGAIDREQLTALNTIKQSGNHLLALIDDVLELAKIEAGQLEIHLMPTAIESLCRSSLVFIQQQAFQKQLQVNVKIQPNLPELHLDERRIRQVLINLLNNAVKFTPTGGQISLEVTYLTTPDSDEDLTLIQGSAGQGDGASPPPPFLAWLRITVTDTGIGISPANINRLFQPFIQIDGALNRQFEGTGLGLALVKRIVDLHGGKVGLSSELGLGSCFTIDLPNDRLPITTTSISIESKSSATSILTGHTAPEFPSSHTTLRQQSHLILLAEDNEANINTMSSYLQAKGYQIVLAHDGQAAILMLRATSPDIILMDIQMPVMDGLTATKQIREFSDVPIIALTALAMTGDRERCLAAGANEYLSKPVKLKQLTTIIQQLLVVKS
jgi:predicted ATPase/signal transduction histidine kinase/CheY-like chemotaxis protein